MNHLVCTRPMLVLAVFLAGVMLIDTRAASAAGTPEQVCQNSRYAEAAKYGACEQKVTGKSLTTDYTKFNEAIAKCRVKYMLTWAKLQAKASGSGSTCDNTRFEDNADGTVTDRLTGLQWEQKTDDASVHDKDDLHTWCADVAPADSSCDNGPLADGTAFTSFLATLNGGGCFAGQCDWRLPTRAELQTILLAEPFPCTTVPCVDEGVFGPTTTIPGYLSATTNAADPGSVWGVGMGNGGLGGFSPKYSPRLVRAVRGGL